MRATALVVTVFLSFAALGCGDGGNVSANCKNGKRLADVAIFVRFDLPTDQQDRFVAREFNSGIDPVGGRTDYSSATAFEGSADGPIVLYLYMDSPLTRHQRDRARAQMRTHPEVDRVAFDVLPIGGFKPAGEC
jgi:hypothetical protein